MSLSISALKATRAFFLSRVCLSLYEPATTYRFPQDVHGPSSSGEPRALFAAQEEAGSCASRAIYANCVYGFIHIIHRYTAIHPSLHIIHTSTHVQYSTSTTHAYTHTHTRARTRTHMQFCDSARRGSGCYSPNNYILRPNRVTCRCHGWQITPRCSLTGRLLARLRKRRVPVLPTPGRIRHRPSPRTMTAVTRIAPTMKVISKTIGRPVKLGNKVISEIWL